MTAEEVESTFGNWGKVLSFEAPPHKDFFFVSSIFTDIEPIACKELLTEVGSRE